MLLHFSSSTTALCFSKFTPLFSSPSPHRLFLRSQQLKRLVNRTNGMASDCGEGTSAVASSTMDSEPVSSASVAPMAGGDRPRIKLEELNWDHSFVRELPGDPRTDRMPREVLHAFYLNVSPSVEVENPKLVAWSQSVADLLDLDPEEFERPDFPMLFSGATPLVGASTFAQCYGGHQFGTWLANWVTVVQSHLVKSRGEGWELQLKGAGKTPYSRFADGLAVLRSSIREFLCSDAWTGNTNYSCSLFGDYWEICCS